MRTGASGRTLVVALALFAALACASEGCEQRAKNNEPTVVLRNSQGADWTVTVELALTPAEHSRGLMHRQSLAQDHGMLFIFNDVRQRRFWMKNTLIPLDMIFIGPDFRIVGIVANAEPLTETERSVPGISQFVLEVNGGECARHGIKAGDPTTFLNVYGRQN